MPAARRPRQLEVWQSRFGQEYTDRNKIDWRIRLGAFQEALQGLPIRSVLEVGCNRGHNLVALSHLLEAGSTLVGVEPNEYALKIALESSTQVQVLRGGAFELPFPDRSFDLVFTAGVLIHIAPADLGRALAEIHRVSGRYVLAIEYFAVEEEAIIYRGNNDLLWKRDFLKLYQRQFPQLTLVRQGYWGTEHGFDRTHWWLLRKPGGPDSLE